MIYVKHIGIINPDRVEGVSELIESRLSSATNPLPGALGKHSVRFIIHMIDRQIPWTCEAIADEHNDRRLELLRDAWCDLRKQLCGEGTGVVTSTA